MKFEFGDLYKFIVSLGVILISLAILTPWLFLKEPFDLFKTTTDLASVTSVARGAIESRQRAVAVILELIPWFSAFSSLVGTAFVAIGLKRWYRNQLLLDEQTKVEVELKKQGLRDATKDEVADMAEREYEAEKSAMGAADHATIVTSFESAYRKVEGQVADRLQAIYDTKFVVEPNKMVAGVEIDVLLRGKTMLTKDYIVEVKTIRRGFNYGWLRESFLKNVYAKNIYAQLMGRIPNTILLIVMDIKGEVTSEKYELLLQRVENERLGRQGKDRVVLITKTELQELAAADLQERLGVYV